MPLIPIESLADPRVAAYVNVKDRDLARWQGRFIAEGEHIVRRLLASDFEAESVLMVERHVGEIGPLIHDYIPAYVVTTALMNGITGMKFHSGILAVGLRKPLRTLDQVVPRDKPLTIVVCPELNNSENLGSLIRLCAGFGVDALLLGPRCHDPFWRLSVRVSMGTIFRLPLYQSQDILADLARLQNEWGVELIATVLDTDAEPLKHAKRSEKLAILLGNEAQGLERETVEACDRRITIPMKLGTDSLNVAVAAGIFLHHFSD